MSQTCFELCQSMVSELNRPVNCSDSWPTILCPDCDTGCPFFMFYNFSG